MLSVQESPCLGPDDEEAFGRSFPVICSQLLLDRDFESSSSSLLVGEDVKKRHGMVWFDRRVLGRSGFGGCSRQMWASPELEINSGALGDADGGTGSHSEFSTSLNNKDKRDKRPKFQI